MYAGMSGLCLSEKAHTSLAYRTMFWSVFSSAYSASFRIGSLSETGDWKHCASEGTRARLRFLESLARPTDADASS